MNNDRIDKSIQMAVNAIAILFCGVLIMAIVTYGIPMFAWMAIQAHDTGANIVGTFWMSAATGFAGLAIAFIGLLAYIMTAIWDNLKKVKNTW